MSVGELFMFHRNVALSWTLTFEVEGSTFFLNVCNHSCTVTVSCCRRSESLYNLYFENILYIFYTYETK